MIINILWLLFCFALPSYSEAKSLIYDEESNSLYLGGVQLDTALSDISNFQSKQKYFNKIYVISKSEEKVLLQIESTIVDFDMSDSGYLAVSTSESDYQNDMFIREFLLYDSTGRKLKTIKNVPVLSDRKFYSWSPDGNKIVYVMGKSLMENRNPFQSEGIWMYDIEKDKSRKISDTGVKVNWSRHDNKIYIQNRFEGEGIVDISEYDPVVGKLIKSERNGIFFTDDGKYYFGYEVYDYEGYLVFARKIYESTSNKRKYSEKENESWKNGVTNFIEFIKNSHNVISWNLRNFMIFDVDKVSSVRKSRKAKLLGWNNDMSKVVVYDGGNKIHIDEMLTGKRLKTLDLPK